MTVSDVAAIIGAITGPAALLLAVLVYYRDRADVLVNLQWDMSITGGGPYDPEKDWGVVTVANVGRRPVFLSHVHLKIPKDAPKMTRALLLTEGIAGNKYLEGDQPQTYMVTQENMEEYSRYWHKIRAVAVDSSGKNYYSNWLTERPSWAGEVEIPRLAITRNKILNRIRDKRL